MTNRYDAMSAKDSNGKTFWNRVGTMFENKNGSGFTLLLDAIPVPVDGSYRISMFPAKDNSGGNSGGGSSSNSSYGGNSGGSGGGFNRPGANRGQPAQNEDDIPF